MRDLHPSAQVTLENSA